MIRFAVCALSIFLLTACFEQRLVTKTSAVEPAPIEKKTLKAVGYGVESDYTNYPAPRKRLLAIRAAKLDAYRSLAEMLYGTRITGVTTVRDAAIESDNFRAYIDAIIHGARLLALTPKGEGIYEAELELVLTKNIYGCFTALTPACIGQTKAYEASAEARALTMPVANGCSNNCGTTTSPEVTYYR